MEGDKEERLQYFLKNG